MNKYTEYDLANSIAQMKIGLFGVLDSFVSSHRTNINLSPHISIQLLIDCANCTGWVTDEDKRVNDSVCLIMSNKGVSIKVSKDSYGSPIKILKYEKD